MFSDASVQEIERRTREIFGEKCRQSGDGEITQEPAFTNRLIEALAAGLNGLQLTYTNSPKPGFGSSSVSEYRLRARALSTQCVNSEESRCGADIIVGFKTIIEGEQVTKAILIQAKLVRADRFTYTPSSQRERDYLLRQCNLMTDVMGADCHIVVYTTQGALHYEASHYIERHPVGLAYDDGADPATLVGNIFRCTAGNREFEYLNEKDFREVLDQMEVENGLELEAVPE